MNTAESILSIFVLSKDIAQIIFVMDGALRGFQTRLARTQTSLNPSSTWTISLRYGCSPLPSNFWLSASVGRTFSACVGLA